MADAVRLVVGDSTGTTREWSVFQMKIEQRTKINPKGKTNHEVVVAALVNGTVEPQSEKPPPNSLAAADQLAQTIISNFSSDHLNVLYYRLHHALNIRLSSAEGVVQRLRGAKP